MKKILICAVAGGLVFSLPASAKDVLPQEPAPGALRPGEVVWVQCAPGKARTVAGGTDRGANGELLSTGSKRKRGPCVKV